MEKKEIVIEGPLKVGNVTVIAVAETLLNCGSGSSGAVFSAAKKPRYIILVSGSEQRAFDPDGQEVSLDRVIAFAPAVEPILNEL